MNSKDVDIFEKMIKICEIPKNKIHEHKRKNAVLEKQKWD